MAVGGQRICWSGSVMSTGPLRGGGAIPSLWTEEGWGYVSVLVDVYSRQVVGWALSHHMEVTLVAAAWRMALGRRSPAAGLRHHSDRGSQYACQAYRGLLAAHGVQGSLSRKGDCLEHAVAERFLGSVKRERTAHRYYAPRQEARDDVIDYIERFSNSRRKHSYLGYVSPNAYEKIAQVA
jgi:putative transposase